MKTKTHSSYQQLQNAATELRQQILETPIGLHPDKAEVVQMVPKKFNNEFMKKPKPAELRPMTDEEMDEWIAGYKQKTDINIFYIPIDFYDYLDKKKLLNLTKVEKQGLIIQAIPFRKKELRDDENKLARFNEMENKGEFTGDEVTRLKDLAKKIAVNEFLKLKI